MKNGKCVFPQESVHGPMGVRTEVRKAGSQVRFLSRKPRSHTCRPGAEQVQRC